MSRRSDETIRHERHHHQGNYDQRSCGRIFEALTNPEQRLKWWGAEGLYRGTHMERSGGTLCLGDDGLAGSLGGRFVMIPRTGLSEGLAHVPFATATELAERAGAALKIVELTS